MQNTLFGLIFMQFKKNRRSITRSEIQIIEKCFSLLFKIILNKDHIPEKFYDTLGFPKYEVSGVVYDSNDVIEREWIQREKLLTHWFRNK